MIIEINTDRVLANPWQVRVNVAAEYIAELAEDIQVNGLLQTPVGRLVKAEGEPYTLREMSDMRREEYHKHLVQLAFGHSRLAAYHLNYDEQRQAVWQRMPVDVRVLTDEQMAMYAWAENEKRREVSPIEKAEAIKRRMDDFGWTQAEVGKRLGMAQSTVGNLLRMLKLPEEVKASVMTGEISQRQGLAVLAAPVEKQAEAAQAARQGVAAEEIRELNKDGKDIKDIYAEIKQGEQVKFPAPEIDPEYEEMERKASARKSLTEAARVYAAAVDLLADKLEIDDVRAWRLLLYALDMDYRQNVRNWELPMVRRKVAANILVNPMSHRQDPAEDYMYVRDLFRKVGLEMPSFEELVK